MSETCKKDDPQCGQCIHSWWNMNAVHETGWCYMFSIKIDGCRQFKPIRQVPLKTELNMMIEGLHDKTAKVEKLERENAELKAQLARAKQDYRDLAKRVGIIVVEAGT
jgi:hypothetical protein